MTPDALRVALDWLDWPAGLAWAVHGPADPDTTLFADEKAAIARAIPKRQAEFAGGRAAARAALAAIGGPSVSIPRDADRAPVWPAGYTGSITHTDGLCVAVAAPLSRFAALGLDVEGADPLEEKLAAYICRPDERGAPHDGKRAKRLFSVKEAVYKAQYPATRRVLGFQAVRVDLQAGRAWYDDAVGLTTPPGGFSFICWDLGDVVLSLCALPGRIGDTDD